MSENVIWNRSLERNPYTIGISNDGSLFTASYTSDGLVRIYGKGSSAPVEEIAVSTPQQCILSGDGSTMVVSGNGLTVFRPSIAIEVIAQDVAVWPNRPVVDIQATVDGQPILGANVSFATSAPNATYEVTEMGDGHYELRIYAFDGVYGSFLHYNITVSKIGLVNVTQQRSVFIQQEEYNYYPPYPSYPDYSGQFNDLGSQVGWLEIIVIILGLVSVTTLIVLLIRPRRPELKKE